MQNADFDRDKILSKLSLIMENMKMLQYLKRLSLEVFIQDFRNVESAKHLLQVSIEAMIDIANHIISRGRLGHPKSYAESFGILHAEGILAPELVESYSVMVKFRNRVVHLYQKVDPDQIYVILQNKLEDFMAFSEEIRLFLRDNS